MEFAPLDQFAPMFLKAGQASNDYLGTVALGFFQVVAWVAIFYGALRVTMGADSIEGSAVQAAGWGIRVYLLGTIAAFLLPTILPALVDGAFGIGSQIGGGKMTAADFMAPSRLAKRGWIEVETLMKHAMSRWNPITLFYYLLASLAVLVSFVAIIIITILSYVYFVMECIGVVMMIMFNGSEKTAWMGRGGPAVLINRFVQLVMMSAILSIGMVITGLVKLKGDPSIAQAVFVGVVWAIVAIAVYKSEQIGSSVVGGMPGPTSGGTAQGLVGMAAGLLGAGAVAMGAMGKGAIQALGSSGGAPGTPNVPPPPPSRGVSSGSPVPSGDPSSGGGGHGSAPFSPSPGAPNPSAAAAEISAKARTLPKGSGEGAEAPTAQQWQDAAIMGTDIVGMTRSQAGAALNDHQGWYMNRGTSGDAAPPTSPSSGPAMPVSHASGAKAAGSVGAPSDWLSPGASGKPAGESSASVSVSDTRNGFGASLDAPTASDRPIMRSAAGATVRRTFSPKSGGTGHQVAMNSFQNDGRFQIGDNQLAYVGQGGGEGGTGYRREGWKPPSVAKTAIPALTGENYWKRRDAAPIKQAHFGSAGRPPVSPKSAAAKAPITDEELERSRVANYATMSITR